MKRFSEITVIVCTYGHLPLLLSTQAAFVFFSLDFDRTKPAWFILLLVAMHVIKNAASSKNAIFSNYAKIRNSSGPITWVCCSGRLDNSICETFCSCKERAGQFPLNVGHTPNREPAYCITTPIKTRIRHWIGFILLNVYGWRVINTFMYVH